MQYKEFGDQNGRLVVYFHGAPGSVDEIELIDVYAKDCGLRILCIDRFSIEESLNGTGYFKELASTINEFSKNEPVSIIAFSIGGYVALEVSKYLKEIEQFHLISSAYPIMSKDDFDMMAGGTIFKIAIKAPFLFKLISMYQKLLAFVAPKLLFKLLFASAKSGDAVISRQESFQATLVSVLRSTYIKGMYGYMRDVFGYVNWKDDHLISLPKLTLWHGKDDNWSALSMVDNLTNRLTTSPEINIIKGASHYSCLHEAVPKICETIST